MTVKIAGQFTKETRDRNGLAPHAAAIVGQDDEWTGYAIVRLECARVAKERRDGWVWHPTAAVVHIELCDGDDEATVREMLTKRYETRTNRQPIPGIDPDHKGDEQRVAGERTDPFYSGPLKDRDGTDVDLLDAGPVSERKPDEWLDKS